MLGSPVSAIRILRSRTVAVRWRPILVFERVPKVGSQAKLNVGLITVPNKGVCGITGASIIFACGLLCPFHKERIEYFDSLGHLFKWSPVCTLT